MAELPPPMHVGDFYLAALLEEFKGLRADLALARAPAPSVVAPFVAVGGEDTGSAPEGPTVYANADVEAPPPGWEPSEDPPPSDPPTKSLLQRLTGR